MTDNDRSKLAAGSNDPAVSVFRAAASRSELEEGAALTPKFDANGLVTVVTTDVESGEVLMVAHMNAEALSRTIASGDVWYWSRSRAELWRKGATSGHTQRVEDIRIDCDQDALWIKVRQTGPACHTNRKSCFYRAVIGNADGTARLEASPA
ncbi:MAG: phosphoribosyl-AMP cyclohydrolase [Beijerinckiaceae bacterium]|nr:phosphoribosyl-AMP cyclohydrolase [Beijerinckiaceae bacterium]